jgi:hypothetical protein
VPLQVVAAEKVPDLVDEVRFGLANLLAQYRQPPVLAGENGIFHPGKVRGHRKL